MSTNPEWDKVAAQSSYFNTRTILAMNKLEEATRWQQRAEAAVLDARKAIADLVTEALEATQQTGATTEGATEK